MGERELTRWVADELHGVLGFSDTSTAQFIVALARKTARSGRGAPELLEGLADVDVPTNAASRAFVGKLMVR